MSKKPAPKAKSTKVESPDDRSIIEAAFVESLKTLTTRGVMLVGANGAPILDGDERPMYRPANPGELKVVHAWLKSTQPKNVDSTVELAERTRQLVAEAARRSAPPPAPRKEAP